MGTFYRRSNMTRLGSCENGSIYDATYSRIGSYEGGRVYDRNLNPLGSYENGTVYDRNLSRLGTYSGGTVYDRNLNPLCTFDGDGAEAAACFLLLHEEYDYASDAQGSSYSSSDNEEAGCSSSGYGGYSGYSGGADSAYTGSTYTGGGAYRGGGASSGGDSGSGIASALLAPLGILLLLFCFGLIWWAIYHATGAADLPYLVIFGLSIVLGLFLGVVVFKISDLIGLYIETVITASIINIVAGFFTSPGYSIFVMILIPPIVTALAAAIPTAITFFSVRLIRMGMKRMGKSK